jgi:hypothetical protein
MRVGRLEIWNNEGGLFLDRVKAKPPVPGR